jgi:hypothetical protein
LFILNSVIIIIYLIISAAALDTLYTALLYLFVHSNNNKTYLNQHIAVYDEELILSKLQTSKGNYKQILESLKALKTLYDELAINFFKTDKQLWGEFMYSSKFYSSIIEREKFDFINIFPNKLNHLINGYGRRWFRALWWIIFVVFLFGLIFTYFVKPNIDYVSTKNTPYFLLQDVELKKGIIYYDEKSFTPFLQINGEWNKNITNINKMLKESNLYGYDNRFNFNNLNAQYILELKNDYIYIIGLCKSLSNLLYPFSFENKKWFENVTPKAFVLSIIESMILWLLILSLIRALWNVVLY